MNVIGSQEHTDELHGFMALLPALMPMAQNLLGKLGSGAASAVPAQYRAYAKPAIDIGTKLAMQRMQSELARLKSENQTQKIVNLIKASRPAPAPRPVYAPRSVATAPAPAPRPVYAPRSVATAPAPPTSASTTKNDMMMPLLIGGGILLAVIMLKK